MDLSLGKLSGGWLSERSGDGDVWMTEVVLRDNNEAVRVAGLAVFSVEGSTVASLERLLINELMRRARE